MTGHGDPPGRGGGHSAPRAWGRSRGSVRARTRGFLSRVSPARHPGCQTGGPFRSPAESAPRRESGWFWLAGLFFRGNVESRAHSSTLTFLQPWPAFAARQQPEVAGAIRHCRPSLPRRPVGPVPRDQERGRTIKPGAPGRAGGPGGLLLFMTQGSAAKRLPGPGGRRRTRDGVISEGRFEVDSPPHCKQRGFIEHLFCAWLGD